MTDVFMMRNSPVYFLNERAHVSEESQKIKKFLSLFRSLKFVGSLSFKNFP